MSMRRRLVFALLAGVMISFLVSHPTAWALMRWSRDPKQLVVPVAGVQPERLSSTFGAPRSGGRQHQGIDIFAHRGTPVLAAAPGRVIRVGHNHLGGRVVWVAGGGARLYYYAHLNSFSVEGGQTVAAGDEIGRVGNSGNAVTTPPHLHFEIHPAGHLFRAVDPAPMLKEQGVVSQGRHA
jgi:murein DD-endopeptidase MepM/ murein hydrolase activator NlpD